MSVLCPWFVDTPIMYGGLDDDDLEGIAKRRESLGEWLKEAVSPDLVGEQVVDGILKMSCLSFVTEGGPGS